MPKQLFNEGEICLVKDKGKFWKAKVLLVQNQNQISKYFIHFQGWNAKWDKWTDDSLMAKLDLSKIEEVRPTEPDTLESRIAKKKVTCFVIATYIYVLDNYKTQEG
jgi:hypothetical protein